jgi:hypothetical protein
MMKCLALFLTTSASLAFVAEGNQQASFEVHPTTCFACAGCVATKVNDQNANPPVTNGVQILSQGAGVKILVSTLTAESGGCLIVTGNDGLSVCNPIKNCEFKAEYTISANGAVGAFHNNGVPCVWSTLAGGFNVLADSITWLQACNNNQSWATADCYNNAVSCVTGTRIVEIKFIGHCSHCQE